MQDGVGRQECELVTGMQTDHQREGERTGETRAIARREQEGRGQSEREKPAHIAGQRKGKEQRKPLRRHRTKQREVVREHAFVGIKRVDQGPTRDDVEREQEAQHEAKNRDAAAISGKIKPDR